jgi:hypothetical protein
LSELLPRKEKVTTRLAIAALSQVIIPKAAITRLGVTNSGRNFQRKKKI